MKTCEYEIWVNKTDYKCLIGKSIIPYKGITGTIQKCGNKAKEYLVYKKMKKNKPDGTEHKVCLCLEHYELVMDNCSEIKEERK